MDVLQSEVCLVRVFGSTPIRLTTEGVRPKPNECVTSRKMATDTSQNGRKAKRNQQKTTARTENPP